MLTLHTMLSVVFQVIKSIEYTKSSVVDSESLCSLKALSELVQHKLICGHYVITFLKQALIINWYMTTFGDKNKHNLMTKKQKERVLQ